MKKTVLLSALMSFIMVGCTPAPTSVIHEVAGDPSVKSMPLVKQTPAKAVVDDQQQAIEICADLVKPQVVKPQTLTVDTNDTKFSKGKQGRLVVSMPFTVLNGFGYIQPILATCSINKDGSGSVELADN